ncbi:alpha/beta hydrolase [Edaphobacter modestus]|uniref:Acetyl esterase/lipase n=1 Tax=Edaphobacter modestus TaxID=388466 RepID=A0A4Q7YXT9_9BACT|nr:alpha/beta hydrolase [Edaphobacter modestus]RZU42274.1 acetyl esterase/lipase [Edaphobacter modestus]
MRSYPYTMVAVRIHLSLTLALLTSLASAQQVTLPLWPKGAPEPYQGAPETDITKPADRLVDGRPLAHLTNISKPTLDFYPAPAAHNTGATVVVFPGGGYRILAYDLEGTEVCTWLNSIGVNCALAQYRVPMEKRYPDDPSDLEDAQQAMRITRAHAAEWHLEPNRVGVLGFSAGAHLVVVLGNHPDFKRANEPTGEASVSARPDFVVAIYPGYLVEPPAHTQLSRGIDPGENTPPTFLLQAEDDPVHEENVLVYFQALKQLKVPAELHVYSEGGHGYGLRPSPLPISHWPSLVETWLNTIHILGPAGKINEKAILNRQ